MANRDVYAKVFGQVIDQMRDGVAPWVRPWTGGSNVPYNAWTRRPYSGGNVLALWAQGAVRGWSDLGFVTFKQALAAKCAVRKGEKATAVYFMSTIEKKRTDGDVDRFFFARAYAVFNVSQLQESEDGALARLAPDATTQTEFERHDAAERTLTESGADIRHSATDCRAYYDRKHDFINLPERALFRSPDAYYGTAFHELTHWTGHESRLKRDLTGNYGQPDYAFEELVAELGAAFLCVHHGMDVVSQSSAYLTSWVRACTEHPELLPRAASRAQRAADLLTGAATAPVLTTATADEE